MVDRIEIIHVRDPDASCYMRLFIDGEEIDHEQFDVDPGAGYTIDDWEETTALDCSLASEKVAEILFELREEAKDSEYIMESM